MDIQTAIFTKRDCPACFAADPRPLFDLAPAQFIRPDYTPESERRFGVNRDRLFPIMRCGSCGFVYAGWAPSPKFMALLYDDPNAPDDAEYHESLRPAWTGHQLRLASALLEAIPAQFGNIRPNILDFGCGFGALVRAVNGPTANCIGFENSAYMVRFMRRQGLPVIDKLDDAPRELHGIVASDVLEHLPEPRQTVRRLRSLLLPGGLLCVSVPDFGKKRVRTLRRQLASGNHVTRELNPWEHLNYFSPASLRRMLGDEGFRVIEAGIDIGLRPNLGGIRRFGNAVKSVGRLAAYVVGSANNSMLALAQAP